MSRRFLDDLGVKPEHYKNSRDELDKHKLEIAVFGFSSEETWNLDVTSAYWLYERLMMFNNVNTCDLNTSSFEVKVIDEDSIKNLAVLRDSYIDYKRQCNSKPFCACKFKTVKLSLQECINTIIQYLKEYIVFFEEENSKPLACSEFLYVSERIQEEKLSCAFGIYAMIINYMWW